MKKIILAIVSSAMLVLLGITVVVPAGTAAEAGHDIVVPRQYVALARMLADSKGDIDKAVEITSKAVSSVVAKGSTYEEKLALLSEISTALLAAVSDWSDADRSAVVRAIVEEALGLASAGDEGSAERVGFIKQVFAAIYYASSDSVALIAAREVLPANLKPMADYAIENAVAVLGGTEAWKCKDLYNAVIVALKGEGGEVRLLSDSMIVTVSTTTTTTTSTSTTTTTIPGAAVVKEIVRPGETTTTTRPSPVPTTKPSPTPVGLR